MLIKLSAPGLKPLGETSAEPFVARICAYRDYPVPARAREALLVDGDGPLPPGFRAYLLKVRRDIQARDVYLLGDDHAYLAHGDIVRIEPARRGLSAIYRRASAYNSFLVTERCDNYCRMCSQPPRDRNDDWLLDELFDILPLIDKSTREIGITGGEPAILGDRLLRYVEALRRELPATAVHMLSNGRAFRSKAFARRLGALQHPDLMVGIPLYGDVPEDHDFQVQARGAFDETLLGVLNLKRYGVRVEVRTVITAENFARLPDLARFIARNLTHVDHVALMGLEQTGFARTNIDALWIDPIDYQTELRAAVFELRSAGMNVSIYNHALCVVPADLRRFARQSISDWKTLYLDACTQCAAKSQCGGHFASTRRVSRGIAPC